MTLVVATTLHAYVTDQKDTSEAWLYNAEAIAASVDDDVVFFAALEVDGRGLVPFSNLLARLGEIETATGDGSTAWWTFRFDDGADEITGANRLRRITTGQNMANTFADDIGASHLLFCAADCAPDPDVLPKLLEMDHPIVGPEIGTYCLSGDVPLAEGRTVYCENCRGTGVYYQGASEFSCTRCEGTGWLRGPLYPNFPVQEHMASAACILLAREVFSKLRWRTDHDAGMTDDPCMHHDALHLLGYPTYVRKDVHARHYPEAIGPIEGRGHDMTVHR